MTAKVRQTNITRFLEASLLRQAEGKLKKISYESETEEIDCPIESVTFHEVLSINHIRV